MMRFSRLILGLLVSPLIVAGYTLVDVVIGNDFYSFFNWQQIKDPSEARVQYVDEATLQRLNLPFASHDTSTLRADHNETKLQASSPRRKPLRIESKRPYTEQVAVLNVRHMPRGCDTWPAILEVTSSGWPSGGFNTIECWNDQSHNVAISHGCITPSSRHQIGHDHPARFPSQNSHGPTLNSGGGWYAVERTTNHFKIWFWGRDDPNTPFDVHTGDSTTDPSGWGEPSVYVPTAPCNFASHFKAQSIVIGLTLGDGLAGVTYKRSEWTSTCVGDVNKNEQVFNNAYFDIASVRIYE